MASQDDGLLHSFLRESEENFAAIEQGLVALENDPENRALVGDIFRHAHTFKGNASCLGFEHLEELSHAFEDVLARLRERQLTVSTELISLLLIGKDALRALVAGVARGGGCVLGPTHLELAARLREAAGTSGSVAVAASDASASTVTPEPPAASPRPAASTLRVEASRLDRMLSLITEITIARVRLERQIGERTRDRVLMDAFRDAEPLFAELQEQLFKVRMVPLGPLFKRYTRVVRDLAEQNGKVARLAIEGGEVEVDLSIAEHLGDALTHMLRNAIDHGIESIESRLRQGKHPEGEIVLRARQVAGGIVIQLSDDGAGLDRRKLQARALERGIPVADGMSDAEIFDLVFQPGFSTADKVTNLSGRGVGMDVVRSKLELLRGMVSIDGQAGVGTTVTIRLPLSVAIIRGFVVGVAGETYVIPLENVVECLPLPAQAPAHDDGSRGMLNVRGTPLPYLRLSHLFAGAGATSAREHVVVVEHDHRRAGFAVDAIHGEMQTVLKPLGKLFHGVEGVSGATILGTGRVALVLDVPGLLRGAVENEVNPCSRS